MAIVIGVLGICVGSFLNVVIYRVPLRRSVVSPPSACTTCGVRVKSYDNIPVISWLLLHGRCRSCKAQIPRRYIYVEVGTGLFFWVVANQFSTTKPLLLIAFLFLAAATIALALIDVDSHTLPNQILIPIFVVGTVLLVADGVASRQYGAILRALLAMLLLGLFYLVLNLIYPEGMGMGDVKLAGPLGLFLGYLSWGILLVGALSAFLLGGLFSLGLVIFRGANRKSGIPFGPWMLTGAWIGIFFGATIFHRYLSLFGLASHV